MALASGDVPAGGWVLVEFPTGYVLQAGVEGAALPARMPWNL